MGGGGGIFAAEFSTINSGQFMIGVMVVVVGGRLRWGGGGGGWKGGGWVRGCLNLRHFMVERRLKADLGIVCVGQGEGDGPTGSEVAEV